MAKYGMIVDLDKCTACQSCVVSCCVENNQTIGNSEDANMSRIPRWLQILPVTDGEYPYITQTLHPMMCFHCDHPPCTYVCPVSATYRNPDGIVAQIYYRCIGCRYCVNACPYTLKFFNWWDPKFPEEMKKGLNPDVAVREGGGVTEKCTFCHHRLQRASEIARIEGREIKEGDYIPACVQACPTGALIFGDLDNSESMVSHLSRSPGAHVFNKELGTDPKVIYLKSRKTE